jgi:hypothetical protein
MLLRDFVFGMLVITGVVLGFTSAWQGFSNNYAVAPITTNLDSFNQLNNTLSIANSLQNNATGIAAMLQNIPLAGDFASVLIAGTQVLTVMFQIPGIFMGMINDMGSMIGLPDWFTSILTIAVTIYVVFAIIGQSVVKGRV